MDEEFFKKVRGIANKPRDQYTKADELTKREATLLAAAFDPYVRGATVIVPPGMTVEDAKRKSYQHDVKEGWKNVTPVMANDIARGIEGIETEGKLNAKLQPFIKQLVGEATQEGYRLALAKLRKDLYHK